MTRTPNWKELSLKNQCGVCAHYVQVFKKGMQTAHGHCRLSGVYKMRTEKCMKYENGRFEEL